MITLKDIYWLAGLLEGEGCFYWQSSVNPNGGVNKCVARIDIRMCDSDIIERVAKIWGTNVSSGHLKATNVSYRTTINSDRAISWMMTLYPLMGRRRKERIKEVISSWKAHKKYAPIQTNCNKCGRVLPVTRICKECRREYMKNYKLRIVS